MLPSGCMILHRSLRVAQAPADHVMGLAEFFGNLLDGEPVGDPRHDFPLGRLQLAEDARYPVAAFSLYIRFGDLRLYDRTRSAEAVPLSRKYSSTRTPDRISRASSRQITANSRRENHPAAALVGFVAFVGCYTFCELVLGQAAGSSGAPSPVVSALASLAGHLRS